MLEFIFLGTGASVPSRRRGLPAVLVRRGDDCILLDCGEGTQRQIMVSPFSFMKISAIFITHLHGDHFYGFPGLIQTMGMMGRTEPLVCRGPAGFSEAVGAAMSMCPSELGFELDVADMEPGMCQDIGFLKVFSFSTEHGVPSLGFVIREPDRPGKFDRKKIAEFGLHGREIEAVRNGETVRGISLNDICSGPRAGKALAYTGDTRRCKSLEEAVCGADILIHESTYADAQSAQAEEYFHSTSRSAAETARDCGCGTLFLIHTSNRYKEPDEIESQAREVFPNVCVPDDLAHYVTTESGVRLISECPPS